MHEQLMTIGRFAQLSGLSVHTLRHYDDVGLLTPADVDPQTGYRRYRRDQIRRARQIQALRWVDLAVEDVRAFLADPESATARQILEKHRDRLVRQHRLLAARIDDVDQFIDQGVTM
jgi:DNA-binding transcriptional MerR regulator